MGPTLCLALALISQAKPDGSPSAESRSKAMRTMAGAVTVSTPGAGAKAELIAEPIYRFDDPARSFSDGSLWAFGRSGRPAALLGFALQKDAGDGFQWLHELVSLSDRPIEAISGRDWTWRPEGEGLIMHPLPDAPAPADDEARRLRQMKDAARRFKASESRIQDPDDPSDRFELRLLPQPVHRYADPASGLVDGAIFLMAYGRNPEIALLIEARRGKSDGPAWSYGLARIAAARLRVSIDDREVADLPKPPLFEPSAPYYLFIRPAVGLKD